MGFFIEAVTARGAKPSIHLSYPSGLGALPQQSSSRRKIYARRINIEWVGFLGRGLRAEHLYKVDFEIISIK